MLNKELQPLLQAINACGNLSGVKIAYSLNKNKKLITAELETLQEAIKPNEKFLEYDKKRIETCKKYADRENGEPKMKDNNFIITDRKEFDKEIEKLNKDNKEILDEREKQGKEFNELLKKESTFAPYMVDYKELPESISVSQLSGIDILINDNK